MFDPEFVMSCVARGQAVAKLLETVKCPLQHLDISDNAIGAVPCTAESVSLQVFWKRRALECVHVELRWGLNIFQQALSFCASTGPLETRALPLHSNTY